MLRPSPETFFFRPFLSRLPADLPSSAVHINSITVQDESNLPHGGYKSSGFGRFGGYIGFEEFVLTKTITWMD